MSRKRKPLPLLQGFEITAVAAEGNALGHADDGITVFVPFAAPGDVADVQLDRKKHRYAQGHIQTLTRPSDLRVPPRCEHFGTCGGCRWQHLPYHYQLQCKQQQVTDALQRLAKVPFPEPMPILGNENTYAYRNKMEYTFSNRKWLTREQLESQQEFPDRDAAGFHIPGAFDKVLDINACHLQEDFGNRLRLFVKDYAKRHGLTFFDLRAQTGLLRTLLIRTASTGQKMAVMVFGQDDPDSIKALMEAIAAQFPEITSLSHVVNTKANDTIADQQIILDHGQDHIEEEMEGLRFRVGPKSFYQTNSAQAARLYAVAREFADLKGHELVYDLYTGAGTIACFLARSCQRVVGIEYVTDAIADAKLNAQANHLDNTDFHAGDMKDILTPDFIATHGQPDVMIIDPPRAGMHPDVVSVILQAQPQRIVYVSCNPATQARDVALLNQKYDITAVRPVDMFPHTAHVENVIRLDLRPQQNP